MKSLKHPLSQSYFVISVMPWFFLETAVGIHVSQDTTLSITMSLWFFMCCISFVQGWIPSEGAWRGPLESSCWIRNNTKRDAATSLCKIMLTDQAFNSRCSLSPISALGLPLVMLVNCRSTISSQGGFLCLSHSSLIGNGTGSILAGPVLCMFSRHWLPFEFNIEYK